MDNNPQSVIPLAQIRERVIQQLSDAFANDLITVEDLESRLEQVYKAQTAAEAQAVVAALMPAGGSMQDQARLIQRKEAMPFERVSFRERFVSVFSSVSRRGPWVVPPQAEVLAVFGDMTLDLGTATLPAEIIDIHVRVVAANLTIVVPRGLRVVNRVGAVLANVESESALDLAPMVPGSPVVRLTGYAVLANVEVVAGPIELGD